jgi:hAT family C-terminal dimerisation region
VVEAEVEEETDFAKLAMKKLMPKAVKDQYQEYTTGSRVLQDPGNLFHWWADQAHISTKQQMAFDYLCISATSCEAFSGCKYTISDHRSRLGEDILEALKCDGAWLCAGL